MWMVRISEHCFLPSSIDKCLNLSNRGISTLPNPPCIKLSERKEGWFRIIVFIVSGLILSIWQVLVKILGLINWVITIVSGKRNKDLAMFCEYWNTEAYKFVRYMTFVSNKKPFPFSDLERISKFEK